MDKLLSFGKLDFKIVGSTEEDHAAPDPETPFRIAILGDFTGRENRAIKETLGNRRFHLIDRDNFDEVLAKLKTEIRLPILGKDLPPVGIRFSQLDDFHPDRLYEKLDVFKTSKDARKKLDDPAAFASVVKKAKNGTERGSAPEVTRPELSGLSAGSLLDQMIETTEGKGGSEKPTAKGSDWDRYLQEIVTPHMVPKEDQGKAELKAAIDDVSAALMQIILHHPHFQAIEAAWRGVHFLTSRVETGEDLRLYILDVSKEELAADLRASDDLRATSLYKDFVEQTVGTPGGEPWALIAGDYTFDYTSKDAELLGRIGKIASRAGAPFLASANPRLLGCESFFMTSDPRRWTIQAPPSDAKAWEMLRKLPEASYLGLALPRFLLRLPYGPETDPVEQFDFEEMEAAPEHEHYLWGNPAFACICLLAQSFSEYGWDFTPGVIQEIDDLPLHLYKEEGESKVKPCAEVVFTQEAAEKILERGFIPLLSYKNRDFVRVARFQSLADPVALLAGPWER